MKIGVFDFGTRASRLLIGDVEKFKENGFNFDFFRNFGQLTELGNGLVEQEEGGYICKIKNLDKTIRFIEHHLKIAEEAGVKKENIITVGTEVFRKPSNWQQVIDTVKNATGVKIQILSPIEEARTSFYAVALSFAEENIGMGPFLVVEQGGGSIQITIAETNFDGTITTLGQTSISELGTLLLRKRFIDFSNERCLFRTVQSDVYNFAHQTIEKIMIDKFPHLKDKLPKRAYGLGRGITEMKKGYTNRKVHGIAVTTNRLLAPIKNKFMENYQNYTVKSLIKDAKDFAIPGESIKSVQSKLEEFYSRPCYGAVLNYFGLEDIKICGTGLRYGVFFRKAHDEWHDIEEFKG